MGGDQSASWFFLQQLKTSHLAVQLNLIGKSIPESPKSVSHQSIQVGLQELIQMSLKVGLGGLGTGADGHGSAIVIVGRWANLFKKVTSHFWS